MLAVLLTLLADAVAMARHPSQWLTAASVRELLLLLGGLLAVTLGVQWLIRKSQEREPIRWGRAFVTGLLATCVLAVYPEQLIHRIDTHLLTVVVGDLVLFGSMRVLLTAIFPYRRDEQQSVPISGGNTVFSSWRTWVMVVAVGLLIGAFAFGGEMREGAGSMPVSRWVFVASVFLGLGLAGIAIAYAFLATPLGLQVARVNDPR